MSTIRRKTREAHRKDLVAVRQELAAPTAAQQQADIEAEQAKAARMRRKAQKEHQ